MPTRSISRQAEEPPGQPGANAACIFPRRVALSGTMREVIAMAGLLVLIAGCGAGTERVVTTRTRTVTVTAGKAASPTQIGRCTSLGAIGQVYKIGQSFRNGDFRITV